MKKIAKLSGWAVASLILGLLGFFTFIAIPAAIALGLFSLYKIKRSAGLLRGTRFAVAGTAIGFAALAFSGFIFAKYELHYRPFRIPTASMSPAIKSKEWILADLAAYKNEKPQRGDIVIYELLDKGKRRLMCKRIVGLPGEEVEIRSGKVFINGTAAEIPGLSNGVIYLNAGKFGVAGEAVKVPEEAYYVLGDNSSVSFDSRQHGPVDRRDVKGRHLFVHKWRLNK